MVLCAVDLTLWCFKFNTIAFNGVFMKIEVQATGNESQRKFQFEHSISVREKTYNDSTAAMTSPVASKIFGFPWTDKVLVGTNSVTITKQDWVEWTVLEEPLKGLLQEHFENAQQPIEENPELQEPQKDNLDSDEAQVIAKLIEEQINPALADHGGYVVLHSVESSKVFLEMGGGCQGCAMSYQTLKEGIEGAIKEAVPGIQEVVDVTNHDQGANPFYT